ncbi:MAG: sel1 repeat family protein [Cardiobacteriaceae bacterium]|nr:sel1 repeat family protein [Cardiobacteriaceae bacterium]
MKKMNYLLAVFSLLLSFNVAFAGTCDDENDCFSKGEKAREDGQLVDALDYFDRACNIEDMSSCLEMAKIYMQGGNGVQADAMRAANLFNTVCEKNQNAEACNALAKLYQLGEVVPANIKKAFELYEVSCGRGNWEACNNQAVLYEQGRGVVQSSQKAYELYLAACNEGDFKSACDNLGMMAQNNNNYAMAAKFYDKNCKNGYGKSCYNLAYLYDKGIGAEQADKEKAARYYQEACDKGDQNGCSKLSAL